MHKVKRVEEILEKYNHYTAEHCLELIRETMKGTAA
jgi:hypothetical protein